MHNTTTIINLSEGILLITQFLEALDGTYKNLVLGIQKKIIPLHKRLQKYCVIF